MSVRGLGAGALIAALAIWTGGCDRGAFCVNCSVDGGDVGDGDGDDGFDNPLPDASTSTDDGGAGRLPDGGLVDVCSPRPGGEICNALDDDCDGAVDEDFDLDADPLNCGVCNSPCQADNADATCSEGVCEVGDCFDGFSDLDGDVGCEYRCPVFPARGEDCNGVDDDCDSVVDETLPAPPVDLCRQTPGTPCAGTAAACDTVEGVTTWYCRYDAAVEFDPIVPNGIALEETSCDGEDGDCDGVADDPWPVGDPCDDGGIGVCRDIGELACDPADDMAVVCDLSVLPDGQAPVTEACNGLDDDCDGLVDNAIVDDMVHIVGGGDFYIFRHEASHPDATGVEQGLADHRACSKPDVMPWTFVTHDQAAAACQAAGKRLCTGAEWEAACGATVYPYGDVYGEDSCNGADYGYSGGGNAPSVLLASGAVLACTSGDGVVDLSGNAKEWTDDQRGTTGDGVPIHVVRGGSYQSPRIGLTCGTTLSQAAATPGQAAIGFRCCSDGAP